MGTRGNIRLHEGKPEQCVLMYAHWSSDTHLPEALKTALKRGEDRWDDPTYLARIIFCDVVRDDLDGLTGYGLASSLNQVDGNDRILDVDCSAQTVTFFGDWGPLSRKSYSFRDFADS